jgi:tetratricopeptide (TPR) repeat protein
LSQWRIAEILFARGDYAGALAALRRTEGDLPGSCTGRLEYHYDLNLAILYEYLGEYRKAVGSYLMAARWLPRERAAIRLLELYQAAGRQGDLATLVRSEGRRDRMREWRGRVNGSILRRGDCWGIASLNTAIDRLSAIRNSQTLLAPAALREILEDGERDPMDDDDLLILSTAMSFARKREERPADDLSPGLKPFIRVSRRVLRTDFEPEPGGPYIVLFPLPPIPKRLALPSSCECLYPSKSGYVCR